MTTYPRPLLQRFQSALAGLQQRVTKLESRTASIDSGFPFAVLPATIDPGYGSGDPKCLVNGALAGPYQHLASYTPAAGDRVILMPVPALQTYVIAGRLA